MRIIGAALVLATLGGCSSNCKEVCDQMADFRRSCGLEVTDADLEECYATTSGSGEGLAAACKQGSIPGTIEEVRTCEDLLDYQP